MAASARTSSHVMPAAACEKHPDRKMRADSSRYRLSPKLYEKKIYFLLFLPALLAHEVGGAEAHEDGDAAAQRSVYVVVGAVIL